MCRLCSIRESDYNQSGLYRYFSAEDRVPQDHPLRRIRGLGDEALSGLNRSFGKIYSSLLPPPKFIGLGQVRRVVRIELYDVGGRVLGAEQLTAPLRASLRSRLDLLRALPPNPVIRAKADTGILSPAGPAMGLMRL